MRAPIVRLSLVKEGSVTYSTRVSTPEEAARIFEEMTWDSATEYFYLAAVDTKNRILAVSELAHGGSNGVGLDVGEIFRTALLAGATGIIVAHNHPSGDTAPSHEDLAITTRIKDCCKLLGIRFLDHLIVADGKAYSMECQTVATLKNRSRDALFS